MFKFVFLFQEFTLLKDQLVNKSFLLSKASIPPNKGIAKLIKTKFSKENIINFILNNIILNIYLLLSTALRAIVEHLRHYKRLPNDGSIPEVNALTNLNYN